MQRRYGAVLGAATAAAVTAALVSPVGSATADPAGSRPSQAHVAAPGTDHTPVAADFNDGKALKKSPALRKLVARHNRAQSRAASDAQVGDTATWLGLDDYNGTIYAKDYTLRGLGKHIEVWVATDTTFPAGDCRNALGMTDITDAQVQRFVDQYDNNILPKESKSFSVAPPQDGTGGQVGVGQVSPDQADDVVTLVDNVRDANYYAPSTPDGQTFIAGFFYSVFNQLTGRNVMTIDANDWLHRTGANPPDDSKDPAYQACAKSQGYDRGYGAPRPRDYEGTFAHEYQHLLESYVDPDEQSWVNEGLSDYAQSLVGYVDTSLPPTAPDADSHIGCFQGFLPESYGGAENSLTLWSDQGGPEILCDYGAAYSFMTYLSSHYGPDFMSALHKQPRNGLAGLNQVLRQFHARDNAITTIHHWLATMAVDGAIDDSGKLRGAKKRTLTSSALDSRINWANPQSFDSLGAPPNGADYVRLGSPRHWLKAKSIDAIRFRGAKSLAPDPVQWSVDKAAPDTTEGIGCGSTEAGTPSTALYSGCGDNLDRAVVRQVSVPAGGKLSFQALWDTEPGWDFGFVQVSTDGGKTYKSLATQDTTAQHDPGAVSNVVAEMPGFTGASGGWKTETADLSAYAGKKVLLAFRYITDPGTSGSGFWVKNISVGATKLPSGSLSGWQSMTQVRPQAVPGWTVQLIGISRAKAVRYAELRLDRSFRGRLAGKALQRALGKRSTTVAALVTMDDPSETLSKYATYHLVVKAPVGMGNRAGR